MMLVTDGEHAAVQALEEGLRLEERVLRFLTTRLQELSDEPSPLLRRQIKNAESARNEDKPAAEDITEIKTVEDKPESVTEATPESAEEKPTEQDVATEVAGDAAS